MEKKIKLLHSFTIIVIIAFSVLQCYWLYNRYEDELVDYENKMFNILIETMNEEYEIRRNNPNLNVSILTNSQMKISSNGTQTGVMTMLFDVYEVDLNTFDIKDNETLNNVAEIYKQDRPVGITKHSFEVENQNNAHNAYDALERFKTDVRNPFRISRVDSILKKKGIEAINISTYKVDSILWNPTRIGHLSKLHPQMTISYPYDPLEGEGVEMTFILGVSPVIKRMSDTLLISLILSVLLITCLITQISTIKKQYKIERLRRDFIHTMIHELKRPISTLKICVSFMRNDQLMYDKDSRASIISDSYNELDNLSSYFSKLRDLTFNDIEEIPLNVSSFNLNDLLGRCIDNIANHHNKELSINIDGDKDAIITADKMHITNIIQNLLENALKYSKDNVTVEIRHFENQDNSVTISVKDNGFGIPKSELKYVFDKFFRSQSVIKRNIPGMGLGLAYVKLLVQAHNGTIEVQSEEGSGTIFIINLPQ